MANQRTTPTGTTMGSPPSDRGSADPAKAEARHVAEAGRQGAGEVAGEARTQAAELARTARDEARQRVDDEVGKLAGFVGDIGQELDDMADNAERADGYLPALARDSAHVANRLSQRLESGGVEGAMDDAAKFARRRPGMFLAAAFGVGLALGRVTRNADLHSISDQMDSADDSGPHEELARTSMPAAIPATSASGPSDIGRMP